jgi:hypothetical protein
MSYRHPCRGMVWKNTKGKSSKIICLIAYVHEKNMFNAISRRLIFFGYSNQTKTQVSWILAQIFLL